ncbi:hypothetical protein Adt_03239 [Abeliophyllum distichum]|uniref:Uncharacterized protein n=1 Tax=Abeliophyllum distichum TaxID=126358 RepID=A0ABD1VY31_9LAMI
MVLVFCPHSPKQPPARVALGDAPSAAALASTCRTSAGDPPVGTPPLGDQFAGSIGAQGMVPVVLPLVFTRGLIRSTLQAIGLDSVILVDVPTSVNSSRFQLDMTYPHLKPMMEHTSIENPLVHLAASTTASLQLAPT